MKNIILLIALASASIGNTLMADGWGQKQTQRTVGGGLSGATIGGIIGHQHGKQKEGIIIGSVLGMIIGNKSGKGADHRAEQQRWEQQQREMAHRERMRRQEQQRIEQARQYRIQQTRQSSPTFGGSTRSSSDELTQARHRAEQREAELHRELEIRRIQEERRRALLEFQERERRAKEQLERIRNGQATPQSISYSPVNY